MIADLYENAHSKDSKNEEILSALFMAYVRVHNYKKQQLTSMKLHKLRPEKNPYYFWTVMSIVMQVLSRANTFHVMAVALCLFFRVLVWKARMTINWQKTLFWYSGR